MIIKGGEYMIKIEELVSLRAGIYTAVAAKIVRATRRFKCKITLTTAEGTANGKSLLGILCLAACYKTEIYIAADGEDEEAAVAALQNLFRSKFATDEQ
jgi:phosphotransferase system HPr (HPr) family protein